MTSWKVRRSIEIALIMLVLLLLFSVVGVPMILLSTFPPSWCRDDLEEPKVDAYGSDTLETPVAV